MHETRHQRLKRGSSLYGKEKSSETGRSIDTIWLCINANQIPSYFCYVHHIHLIWYRLHSSSNRMRIGSKRYEKHLLHALWEWWLQSMCSSFVILKIGIQFPERTTTLSLFISMLMSKIATSFSSPTSAQTRSEGKRCSTGNTIKRDPLSFRFNTHRNHIHRDDSPIHITFT